MEEPINLEELLKRLKIEVTGEGKPSREVMMPPDMVGLIKGLSAEEQTSVLQGLLRLAYDNCLVDAIQIPEYGEHVFSIRVPGRCPHE